MVVSNDNFQTASDDDLFESIKGGLRSYIEEGNRGDIDIIIHSRSIFEKDSCEQRDDISDYIGRNLSRTDREDVDAKRKSPESGKVGASNQSVTIASNVLVKKIMKNSVSLNRDKITNHPNISSSNESDSSENTMRCPRIPHSGFVVNEFPLKDWNNTELHIACLRHYPDKMITSHLLQRSWKDISTENSNGELPLHSAMRDKLGISKNVLEEILDANPEAVKHLNKENSLPIHIACQAGAPSVYAVKRLLEIYPSSLMHQSNLKLELERRQGLSHTSTCDDPYETGWSPLHLATINRCMPDIIEAFLELRPTCFLLKTNHGRTALDCARWVIINALLKATPFSYLKKIFATIQILESHEREIVLKSLLIEKTKETNKIMNSLKGIPVTLLSSMTSCIPTEKMIEEQQPSGSFDDEFDLQSVFTVQGDSMEEPCTLLHKAVADKTPLDRFSRILDNNTESLFEQDEMGNTPIDVARFMIIVALYKREFTSSLRNTLQVLELMEKKQAEYMDQYNTDEPSTPKTTPDEAWAMMEKISLGKRTKPTVFWSSLIDRYKHFKLYSSKCGSSLLGPIIPDDAYASKKPEGFHHPETLQHVNLKIKLPVGFRRVRWALLSQKSKFLQSLLQNRLKCSRFKLSNWDRYPELLGSPKAVNFESFVLDASRSIKYTSPDTDHFPEHEVDERFQVKVYNDYCFVIHSIKKMVGFKFSDDYEIHSQIMFINEGVNKCHMTCSTEIIYHDEKPHIAWLIHAAVRSSMSEYFHHIADSICDNCYF